MASTKTLSLPWGFRWRSSKRFILTVVVISLFLDLFLYGLIVPVIPFILTDRLKLPQDLVQSATSGLLAAHAVATFLSAPLIGVSIDGPMSRRQPFLFGLIVALGATVMLCFGDTVWELVLARLLQGASAAIVWIVGLTIVTDTVHPNHLGRALGAVYSVTTFGALISPTVGGLVYTQLGYYPVYFLAGFLLSIDIVLRCCMIDKERAKLYLDCVVLESEFSSSHADERSRLLLTLEGNQLGALENHEPHHPSQTRLPDHYDQDHRSKSQISSPGTFTRRFPLLAIMSDPRLVAATFVTFTHACFVGMFNATLPIHVQAIFGMSSLESGLLFVAIELPYMFCGPLVGWWVDRSGPRGPASAGAILLVPALSLLGLPQSTQDLPFLVILLALNGIGLSATSSSAFVQANNIGRERHLADPTLFGSKGPYGQLYALNNVLYSLGMTLGPLVAGLLTNTLGYGNAMVFMAAQAAMTAVIALNWMEK